MRHIPKLGRTCNNSTWRNDDVIHWHYAEFKHTVLEKIGQRDTCKEHSPNT